MLAAPALVTLLADDSVVPKTQVTQLDVQAMAALLGLFVPIVVALVTKKYSSNLVKAVVNVLASVAVAVIAVWAQYDGKVTLWAVVNTIIVTLVASISAYQAFWKNVNLNDKTLPNSGIGTPTSNPDAVGKLR